jgi:hypothetical protein
MTEGTALVEIGIAHELAEGSGKPRALFLKEARAAERFFDFFTANIRNKHTRRASPANSRNSARSAAFTNLST